MVKKLASIVAVLLLVAAWSSVLAQETQPPPAQAQEQPKEGKLELKMTYSGKEGPVDDVHKIIVFVFDRPEIQEGVMPISFGTVNTNGGTASFNLSQSPVYLVAVYDKQGNYEFTGPPPSGSPVTMYMKQPPAPEPVVIEPGKTTSISIEFDDTMRMP